MFYKLILVYLREIVSTIQDGDILPDPSLASLRSIVEDGVLVVHGDQGVGDGRDDRVASPAHCGREVEAGQAGRVEDSDGHRDGEQAQTQLV